MLWHWLCADAAVVNTKAIATISDFSTVCAFLFGQEIHKIGRVVRSPLAHAHLAHFAEGDLLRGVAIMA
jgi:hypothetical protein